MDVLSSTPVSLWVDFEAPQGLVIPDVGTTSYSLYDSAGAPLAVQQALTPAADATGVSVQILAIHNVLTPDHDFERRQVVVSWLSDGQSYSLRRAYRVITLPLHTVTAEDVRNYLAINEDELRDEEVDIFASTLQLEDLVGRTRLNEALASGTIAEIRAQRAVLLQAAASLFPSLRFRIAQSKTDGTAKFERLKDAKAFNDLVTSTLGELSEIVADIVGDTSSAEVIPTIFLLAGPTLDRITGAAPVTSGA